MSTRTIKLLRKIGIAEGASFLILLLIAMPLKYTFGMPEAVKYAGSAHGFFFVAYVGLAYYAKEVYNWSFKRFLLAFVSAWLPLGTFFFDGRLKIEEKRIEAGLH
jgi:integral membrane protein